ncbi:MAG: diguanylate cyclase [Candidatus Riflebacteria bacterium]|nr:diguanylate cyclase [Candidatus Riflebacteria bacterium]
MENVITVSSSLKFKFIIGISLLIGLILILTLTNTSYREEQLISESMDQSGMGLSATLALACQDPIIRQAYDELVPYTERIIVGGEDVQDISIVDQDGKYLAYRSRSEGPNKLGQIMNPDEKQIYQSCDIPQRLSNTARHCLEYVAPIRVGSSLLGTIILRYGLERLETAQSDSRKGLAVIGLLALLAGTLLAVLLAQFITSGIDSMMKGTLIVSTGDLSYRLEVKSQDEIGMLAERFNEMVVALESNRKALDRKIFEIETLFRASQVMNFQSDVEKLIRQILEMASRALKSERASIMLLAEGNEELVTKIVYGLENRKEALEPLTKTHIKSGEGVAGTVLKTGASIIVNEGHNDPLFRSYDTSVMFEHLIRNMISVPLKIKDRVTGVINIVNKLDETGFNADDQRLLEALAQQAAMAVENARLYELAITDGLTKLFIHRYFQARLEEEIVRAKRYHTVVSLILFDIDHFKKFNDTYGHQQGDLVLIEVAKLLKLTVRDTIDIPARYGGEEFTIILPETDAAGALLVAERLRKTIESNEFPGQGMPLKVTISLGIATYPDHAANRATLIKKSDMALYACKKRGRNCSSIYEDSMTECE